MTRPGIFITFEGSEGCGKTTQIALLATALQATGRKVIVTREPGGTPIGEQIRHTLQHSRESEAMAPETELLLFAASRAQLVREIIEPALAQGVDVISDRFLDSTTVYQGVARRLDPADVAHINAFAVGDRTPDLTFILDLSAGEARRRVFDRPGTDAAPDRIEREPLEFYENVRGGYLALAPTSPRFHVLDASLSRETLAGQIIRTVQEVIDGVSAPARA